MFELNPSQQRFVEAQVATGRFSDSSEVIQAGIDLLRREAEQREYDETVADVRQGIKDYEQGKGQSVSEAFSDIRRSIGLAE